MAAGLGFKTFNTGDVLSAADVNGYLMQGVLVFADATARDAAITSPEEGQFAFLKDTNVTTYYTGSAWANLDTTGMTNPMTTTGDTIYSSSGSTPARLGIGTVGQVLTVNSGATAPEWATPAGGGGKVLQVVNATTSSALTVSSTTFTDTNLTGTITPTSASSKVLVLVTQPSALVRDNQQLGGLVKLVRGANDLMDFNAGLSSTASSSDSALYALTSFSYLDSPATTSATTYKTQGKVTTTANNSTHRFQFDSKLSSITLLEIGV
jgi:hypothetical protein